VFWSRDRQCEEDDMTFPKAGLVLLMWGALAVSAWAQGGGASATGTIQGRVTDAQGAVLPGVTVSATSPAMLGQQTTVTSETGNYRFPAVPPGVYTVSYELAGFNTLKREGIQISLGFTANLNVELTLATLQETVTVTGASPVIDTSATRIQQNFKVEELRSIPNGRDMWALLAVTPAVQMTRIDVGGNRAGTQTGYSAYGLSGQVRVLIEGINTTEGTGGAGFYFDYSSIDEAFLGTSGQGAEMPNPGVQSQFITKSGGNMFSGELYYDWYNNSLQGSNLTGKLTQPVAEGGFGLRPGSNEITTYFDRAVNLGGPIVKDKLWWFSTYREQFNAVQQPNFVGDLAGKTLDTKLWNPIGKLTYQVNPKNKIIGYYQWGQKVMPNRLPYGTYSYTKEEQTNRQDSGSWVYKGEWNSTINDKLYVEARYGEFGYYFPLSANGSAGYHFRDTGRLTVEGTHQQWQLDRQRKQITGAATYFLDTANAGTHTFKFGGEQLFETGWEGYLERFGGNRDLIYTNGVSNQVTFAFPTATKVNALDAREQLLTSSKLGVTGLFFTDTWNVGRLTMNLGARWDRYSGSLPEQQQLGGTNGPVTIPAQTFAAVDLYTWNGFAPRIGATYDFSGTGKSVLKANYGLFWHNPGVGLGGNANPNQSSKTITYAWNDANGNRRFDAGENGANAISTNLAGAVQFDRNIKQPFTHEASAFFEQQLTDTLGVRAGYVYKTEADLTGQWQALRPASAYTQSFNWAAPSGEVLTLFGIPNAQLSNFPNTAVVSNVPGRQSRFDTAEFSFNKRYGNKWSAQGGAAYTWLNDFRTGVTASSNAHPNAPGQVKTSFWSVKLTGSYDAPLGIRISPVMRHQSGANYARQIQVPASAAPAALNLFFPGVTVFADAANANRVDKIWVYDLRFDRTFNLGNRIKFRGFVDIFNLTNSNASEVIAQVTGPRYQFPVNVLGPRTMRLGGRILW